MKTTNREYLQMKVKTIVRLTDNKGLRIDGYSWSDRCIRYRLIEITDFETMAQRTITNQTYKFREFSIFLDGMIEAYRLINYKGGF